MGLSHSPKIVTEGLILCLDAQNPKSYPGSGTTWTNLGSTAINGTLDTGDTFISDNPQSFLLDGTAAADIAVGTGNTYFPLYSFSLEAWFKTPGLAGGMSASGIFGITYGIRLYVDGSGFLRYGVDNGVSLATISSGAVDYADDNWHHVIATKNLTGGILYVDNELRNTESESWTGTTRWPTNTANIGRDNNDAIYYFNGNLALIKIYDIQLSADQVAQNYNATKGRFGL